MSVHREVNTQPRHSGLSVYWGSRIFLIIPSPQLAHGDFIFLAEKSSQACVCRCTLRRRTSVKRAGLFVPGHQTTLAALAIRYPRRSVAGLRICIMCALLNFEREKSVDITWPSIRDSVRRTEFQYAVVFEGSSLKRCVI